MLSIRGLDSAGAGHHHFLKIRQVGNESREADERFKELETAWRRALDEGLEAPPSN